MTENEAIMGLKHIFSEFELNLPFTDSLEILNMTIKALEEIQEYRKIGTVDECKAAVKKQKPRKPLQAEKHQQKAGYKYKWVYRK